MESYHDKMRHIYNPSNADINRDCVEYFTSLAGGEAPATTALEEENLGPEACIFAQHSWPFLRHPIFVLNSQYDSWQIEQMLGFTSARYADKIHAYGAELSKQIIGCVNGSAPIHQQRQQNRTLRHGAFIDSCEHHIGQYGSQINGVTMMEALSNWIDAQISKEWENVEQELFDDRKWPWVKCCKQVLFEDNKLMVALE
mmetsp:Transcript_30781/g.57037  ORF Transcript_30781/g.57037 Transcript_30781/m.57037 type:complete len:199 (+) Transcript_30781:1063-1659(+)